MPAHQYLDAARLLTHFLALVRIDSPSFHEHQIAEFLQRDLEALGLETANDRSGPNGVGNVIGRLPSTTGTPIGLCAHMDTVEPGRGVKPHVADGVIRSDGTTVLGADCKAGVAAIVEALRGVVQHQLPHGPIEVIFTYGEEAGHAGSKSLDLSAISAQLVIVADGVGPPGMVTVESPSTLSFIAIVNGIAAHAGLEPERGLSAISVAAEAICRMPLGRIDQETTANVGLISGGSARNAVPDRVRIEGEARSTDAQKLSELSAALRDAVEGAAAAMGTDAQFSLNREYTGYRLDEKNTAVAMAFRAARSIGLRPKGVKTGGGSDANSFNERKVPSVALGLGMEQPHTLDERIRIDDLAQSTALVTAIIADAAESDRGL